MNRRKYILTTGGVIALAGCSGESEEDSPTEEEEPETEEEEANFETWITLNDNETYSKNDEVAIGARIENTGDLTGNQTIEIDSSWYSYSEEVELEPGEIVDFDKRWDNPSDIESDEAVGELEYTVRTEDDEITGSLIIGPANFEVSLLEITSNSIDPQDNTDITCEVSNTGLIEGNMEVTLRLFSMNYSSKSLELDGGEKEVLEFSISGNELALGRNDFELIAPDDNLEFNIELNVEEDHYETYMNSMSNLATDVQNILTGYRNNDHITFEITMPAESEDNIRFDLRYIVGGYLGYAETGMVPAKIEGEITDILFNNHISDFNVEKEWIIKYLHGDYSINDVMNELENTLDLD